MFRCLRHSWVARDQIAGLIAPGSGSRQDEEPRGTAGEEQAGFLLL